MSQNSLERRIKAIPSLDPPALNDQYQRLHGHPPESASPRQLIELAVAVRLQKALIAHLRSRLYQVLTAAESISEVVSNAAADAVLIREWKGTCHLVTLIDDGAMVQGQWYATLEEAAKVITKGKRTAEQFFGMEGSHGSVV